MWNNPKAHAPRKTKTNFFILGQFFQAKLQQYKESHLEKAATRS